MLALLVPIVWESGLQLQEDAFLRETALRVVGDAHAVTPHEHILALHIR